MYRVGCGFMVLLIALVVLPAHAADKKKPVPTPPEVKRGPEHKILEFLTGVFDAKVKFYIDPTTKPIESTGVLSRRMILDGNYLEESFKGTFFGKAFAGTGFIGYDPYKKRFVTSWVDNMSTSMLILHGTYDPKKLTLTSVGDDYSFDAKKMKARDVLRIITADDQVFEMFRQEEGAKTESRVMEITYKRRAK